MSGIFVCLGGSDIPVAIGIASSEDVDSTSLAKLISRVKPRKSLAVALTELDSKYSLQSYHCARSKSNDLQKTKVRHKVVNICRFLPLAFRLPTDGTTCWRGSRLLQMKIKHRHRDLACPGIGKLLFELLYPAFKRGNVIAFFALRRLIVCAGTLEPSSRLLTCRA